jgi:hypothetical protein
MVDRCILKDTKIFKCFVNAFGCIYSVFQMYLYYIYDVFYCISMYFKVFIICFNVFQCVSMYLNAFQCISLDLNVV